MTDRSVLVRLRLDPKGFIAGAKAAGHAVNDLRKDIDKTNDRTAWLAQSFLALAPTIGPIGAAAVPALAGIATQLTATALAAGVATLAFNGVGDALKALNDYQIDPTDAHLKKMHETMALIGPTGRDLVRQLDVMRDGFIGLSNLARDNMFPGVIEGFHEMEDLFPQVQQIIAKTAAVLGDLADRAGEGLSGPGFEDFFNFLESDGVPTLDAMGRTIGNIVEGLGAMLAAFVPLSRDFTGGFLEMSRSFAEWAHGLRDNASFQEFIDYVRENTPKVLDLVAQLADTFIALVEAGAPVGEVIIPLLTTFLGFVQAIADSPLGPILLGAVAAMSLYGRAAALASISTSGLGKQLAKTAFGFEAITAKAKKGEKAVTTYKVGLGRAAGGVGLFALALSPLPEKLGLSNAAMGAMAGLMVGGPWGAAIGAGIGLLSDFSSGAAHVVIDQEALGDTLNKQTGAITKNTREWVANELAKSGALQAARDIGLDGGLLIDSALGDPLAVERATRAFDQLNAAMVKGREEGTVTADQLSEFRTKSQLLSSAVGVTSTAIIDQRDKMLLVGDAVSTTARKYQKAVKEIDYFKLALDSLDASLDERANMRDYQASLDDLARSVRDNGKTLDINSKKGRDNQAALDGIVGSIKSVAETMKGSERQEFLKHAREDFVDAAIKAGKTEQGARDLAKELGIVGLIHAKPAIAPKGFEKTFSEIDKLQDQLVILDNFVARPRVVFARDSNFHFGEGPGFAEGGYTGNAPVNQPAGLVHGKEFVFSAPATEGNVGMLTKLHDHLKGYSNGGYVAATGSQPTAAYAGMAPGDLNQIVAALLGTRQLYGDVHVNGDPTVWRRQMEDDNRAVSTGKLG